jgi:cell division protein FtsI/penicillin-binding protein 2
MNLRKILMILLLLVAAGCAEPTVLPTATPTAAAPTATLGQPQVQTTSVPDVKEAAQSYLDAWQVEDYPSMYAMLTSNSQDAITQEKFTEIYRSVAAEAALSSWDYVLLQSLTNPHTAQVGYRVTLHSVLVGDITGETLMNCSLEEGKWRVQWDEALILPELRDENYLRMEYQSPSRANIYDRNGEALVAQADAVAIGLNAGKVNPETENALLAELNRITGVSPDQIKPTLDSYRANDWYLPVADISVEALAPREAALSRYEGVILSYYKARYYFDGGIAPHVIGYVSAIQEGDVEYYKRLGYNVWSDRVGQMGLEAWGEAYLGGKRGGVLNLVGPDGKIITRLAESSPEPSQSIYTTLDKEFQIGVQEALGDFTGAIVVLERDTGRVLAMASSPTFNPNLFEPQNANYSYQINDLFDPYRVPLLNRATQGQYPLGSVFKIVTISAALQSGVFTPESEYDCGYFFTELFDVTLNDWTYDHFKEDGKTQPSGKLTLPQGLMRSCNPWFWHIGLTLYDMGMHTTISDMARGFGLGSKTGIEIAEETGQIPDPASQIDATNLAIGQGATQVTPLQVASFVAAVGNGGYLYEPKIVERISPLDGEPTYVFTPTLSSRLPISDTTLTVVQDAMVSVVSNPRGTAYYVLNPFISSYNIPIAGKTGTAESGLGEPHAWFAGYTLAGREGKPDIAVAVLVETIGEGSEYAAPIFRRVMELYFLGQPQVKYPWEARIGVVASPTPEPSETPLFEPEPTPTNAP